MTWFKKEDEKEGKEKREELKLSDELWISVIPVMNHLPEGH